MATLRGQLENNYWGSELQTLLKSADDYGHDLDYPCSEINFLHQDDDFEILEDLNEDLPWMENCVGEKIFYNYIEYPFGKLTEDAKAVLSTGLGEDAEDIGNYDLIEKVSNLINQAWNNWADDLTREFWEGEEKPESETDSFILDWIENADFWADGFDTRKMNHKLELEA